MSTLEDVEGWLRANRARNSHSRQVSILTSPDRKAKRCSINWWSIFTHILTFWAPSFILKRFGYQDYETRQAFREKISLCIIIMFLCALLAFFTFGLGPLLCPRSAYSDRILYNAFNQSDHSNTTWARGKIYDSESLAKSLNINRGGIEGKDISSKIASSPDLQCERVLKKDFWTCTALGPCYDRNLIDRSPFQRVISFDWGDILNDPYLVVYDQSVLRLPKENISDRPRVNNMLVKLNSKDLTRSVARLPYGGRRFRRCLLEHFKVGELSSKTPGCFAYFVIQVIALLVIGIVVFIRFILAVLFSWLISRRLDQMNIERKKNELGHIRTPSVYSKLPSFQNIFPPKVMKAIKNTLNQDDLSNFALQTIALGQDLSEDPYVILLVTCYSEGSESLKLTLDSLALTDYHDRRKLIMIIVDGQVKGAGNDKTTDAIVLELIRVEECFLEGETKAYKACASGSLEYNMAKVYPGLYHCRGREVPVIVISKCGSPAEKLNAKPGNRGKRDSQLILMNFMQRVIFNDQMTPLDYDLFNKICWLLGTPPDSLEIVLMVDADTKVAPDSLGRMINAMRRDKKVIGLCGETRIANKRSTWVTAIQVFEYYISHHLGKAFESVFGGVTCLPGCFCMYRIKVEKSCQTLPVLASPTVIEEYSQTKVDTLHKKNLLLLGEDRFLTTLMLKSFPKRKIIFVPQAYCKTFVPEEFSVLLSQRRRWINSTIHNLMELILVNDLCGTFCFSMQFVIFMELIGTIVLPAAVVFTYILIGFAIVNPRQALIPLILLGIILGLPAVLILITTRKLVYIWWMMAYLMALPIWNFVLPLYSFWHFDDFSWGETRKIEGKDLGHVTLSEVDEGREEAFNELQMKTWLAWTRSYEQHEDNH